MTVMQEFTKGLWKELAAFPPGAGALSHPGRDQFGGQRSGHGPGGYFRAGAFQYVDFHGAQHHSQEGAHRLLHRHRGVAGGGRGTAHAAYAYPLYQRLGIFVPLIVVNCIILAGLKPLPPKTAWPPLWPTVWAWAWASRFPDILGSLREIWGNGTWFGHAIMWDGFEPFRIMVKAPGAFICLGLILAGMNLINFWQARRQGP